MNESHYSVHLRCVQESLKLFTVLFLAIITIAALIPTPFLSYSIDFGSPSDTSGSAFIGGPDDRMSPRFTSSTISYRNITSNYFYVNLEGQFLYHTSLVSMYFKVGKVLPVNKTIKVGLRHQNNRTFSYKVIIVCNRTSSGGFNPDNPLWWTTYHLSWNITSPGNSIEILIMKSTAIELPCDWINISIGRSEGFRQTVIFLQIVFSASIIVQLITLVRACRYES